MVGRDWTRGAGTNKTEALHLNKKDEYTEVNFIIIYNDLESSTATIAYKIICSCLERFVFTYLFSEYSDVEIIRITWKGYDMIFHIFIDVFK